MRIKWSPIWQLTNELQGIVLIGFSLVIFKLYVREELIAFVAPKMAPYLFVSMIILFFLGFFRLLNSNLNGADCDCDVCDEKSHPLKIMFTYGLFFLPLFLFFPLKDYHMNRDLLPNLQYEHASSSVLGIKSYENQKIERDSFILHDDNYLEMMDEINERLDEIIGKDIIIQGFIHREEDFSEKEVVVARYVMTHCIADLGMYGFLLKGDVEKLATDEWYEIRGTIQKEGMDGGMMPIIHLNDAHEVQPPKDSYIYAIQ